jgi:glycosyltransferase involved in cell wall biosynthesis
MMTPQSSPARYLYYVVDWLPPDFGAVGQYALVFAREMANAGRQVHLIGLTSGQPGTTNEQVAAGGALKITRIAMPTYDRTHYASRLLWLVRANLRLIAAVMRDSRSRGSEMIFTGAPPFMLFFALIVKYLRGVRIIYRITDFYPEVILAEVGRRSLLLAILERLTWAARRRVDIFQALGEDQRALLIAGGIPPQRIVLKRDFSPVHITGRETPAAPPEALQGRAVLLYSGNYAVAHEVDTVVEGLIRHYRAGSGAFGLWLNASGKNVERVERKLRDANIPVARTQPVVIDELPSLLAAADLHLITLRSPFSGIVLPSKVYACIASRRPILFVGPESSDVHRLCSEASIDYEHIEPGDVDKFAAALERFASAPSTYRPDRSALTNVQK